MKKVSISLFALLAIVFAVSSAFTTTSKKNVAQKAPIEYRAFLIDPNSLVDASETDPQVILDEQIQALTSFQSSPNDLDAFDEAEDCTGSTDYLCLADIEFDNQVAISVESVKVGQYNQ